MSSLMLQSVTICVPHPRRRAFAASKFFRVLPPRTDFACHNARTMKIAAATLFALAAAPTVSGTPPFLSDIADMLLLYSACSLFAQPRPLVWASIWCLMMLLVTS